MAESNSSSAPVGTATLLRSAYQLVAELISRLQVSFEELRSEYAVRISSLEELNTQLDLDANCLRKYYGRVEDDNISLQTKVREITEKSDLVKREMDYLKITVHKLENEKQELHHQLNAANDQFDSQQSTMKLKFAVLEKQFEELIENQEITKQNFGKIISVLSSTLEM